MERLAGRTWLGGGTIALALSLIVAATGCNRSGTADNTRDQEINSTVQGRINSDPQLQGLSINVQTRDGVVTLSGSPAGAAQRIQAENDANVPGVQRVVDQLPTMPQTASNNPEPATTATAANEPATEPVPAPARHARRHRTRKTLPATTSPGIASTSESANASTAGTAVSGASALAGGTNASEVAVTVPAGTVFQVRLNQALASDTSQPGQTWQGEIAQPVAVDGNTVIPAGAVAHGVVYAAASAGHLKGQSELGLRLTSVSYNGNQYNVTAADLMRYGAPRGKRTVETVGGGAGIGALVGAIIGHGKGAAIGAATGAGAGTAAEVLTKPEQVRYPAETVVRFTLSSPLQASPAGAELQ